MQPYTVVNPEGVTLNSGILALSDTQASARKHRLADLGDGLFEIKGPVTFKCGELFEYDGDVNRSLALEIKPAVRSKKPRKEQ